MTSTAPSNGIEVHGPGARVQERPARRRRHRPRGRPGRDLRLPRPERGRQVDHRPHADHPPAATAGHRAVAGYDIVREGAGGPRRDRRRPPGGGARPLLTGREHMRLQGGLHGLAARPRSSGAATSCSSGSAWPRPPTASVGGYSGGMKRRLDLALALVHEPAVLFLDEPTTGLDIQSRAALWDEVARLARDEGVTVFLTTQYLEEADELADRVGIIDRGSIVAEGTPAALKAEIGRPTVEAMPADRDRARARCEAILARFGEPLPARATDAAVRLTTGSRSSPTSSARSTPRGSGSPTSSCTRRASTTSSSPRPAARSRAPATSRRGRDRRARPRAGTGVAVIGCPRPTATAALASAGALPGAGARDPAHRCASRS